MSVEQDRQIVIEYLKNRVEIIKNEKLHRTLLNIDCSSLHEEMEQLEQLIQDIRDIK